jgi:hypothetical protein
MPIRVVLALGWLCIALIGLILTAVWLVFAVAMGHVPLFPRARRRRIDRRIPGRLVRLEDLAPADREIFATFRRIA